MTRNTKAATTMVSALAALVMSGGGRPPTAPPPRRAQTDKHRETGQGSKERNRRMRQLARRGKAEAQPNRPTA